MPDSLLLLVVAAGGWLGLLAELLELAVELLLPAELLELLLGGGSLVGGDDSGLVGVLAVGQPANSRHRQAVPPTLYSRRRAALLNVKGFNKFFSLYWLSCLKSRAEDCTAQPPHQTISLFVFLRIVIQALYVLHPARLTHAERQSDSLLIGRHDRRQQADLCHRWQRNGLTE